MKRKIQAGKHFINPLSLVRASSHFANYGMICPLSTDNVSPLLGKGLDSLIFAKYTSMGTERWQTADDHDAFWNKEVARYSRKGVHVSLLKIKLHRMVPFTTAVVCF